MSSIPHPNYDRATWGWAASRAIVDDRIALAQTYVGGLLQSVRYVSLASVLDDEGFDFDTFHVATFAVVFGLADGREFHVTWDPPSSTQSLRFAAGAYSLDDHLSLTDVTERAPWAIHVGRPIVCIDLNYEPWDDEEGSWELVVVDVVFAPSAVRLTGGDVSWPELTLTPSADSVAVLVEAVPRSEQAGSAGVSRFLERNVDPDSLGWAETLAEVESRRVAASALVGQSLVSVRYIHIDYTRYDREEPVADGYREITDEAEWEQPDWKYSTFHSIDYAIELTTNTGSEYFISYDVPGMTESMSFGVGQFRRTHLSSGANIAIWDVSSSEPWSRVVGKPVERVQLDYEPWSEHGGFWCTAVVLHIGGEQIRVVFGEGEMDGTLGPAYENLAVLLS
jgi:hypothetical protein